MRRHMFERLSVADMKLFKEQNRQWFVQHAWCTKCRPAQACWWSLPDADQRQPDQLALLGYLFYLNRKLTLIVIVIFPALILVMRVLSKRLLQPDPIQPESHRCPGLRGGRKRAGPLADPLARRTGRPGPAVRYAEPRTAQAGPQVHHRLAAMTPLTQMLAAAALSSVIATALWQSNTSGVTVGSFVSFVTAMLMLIAPIKHLAKLPGPSRAAWPRWSGFAAD